MYGTVVYCNVVYLLCAVLAHVYSACSLTQVLGFVQGLWAVGFAEFDCAVTELQVDLEHTART